MDRDPRASVRGFGRKRRRGAPRLLWPMSPTGRMSNPVPLPPPPPRKVAILRSSGPPNKPSRGHCFGEDLWTSARALPAIWFSDRSRLISLPDAQDTESAAACCKSVFEAREGGRGHLVPDQIVRASYSNIP